MIKVTIENDNPDVQINKPIEGDISLVAVLKKRKNSDEQTVNYTYQTNLHGFGSTGDVLFLGAGAQIAAWRQAAIDILKHNPDANIDELFTYILEKSRDAMIPLARNLKKEIEEYISQKASS